MSLYSVQKLSCFKVIVYRCAKCANMIRRSVVVASAVVLLSENGPFLAPIIPLILLFSENNSFNSDIELDSLFDAQSAFRL